MANGLLRPGVWTLVNTTTNAQEYRLDYELLTLPPSATVDVQVIRMFFFNYQYITAYRSAPVPQTPSGNTGSEIDSSGQSISGELNPYTTLKKIKAS